MSDVNSEKTARVFTNADEDEVPEPDHEDPHAFTRAGLIPKWRVTWFDDDKDSWDFLDYDNADAQQAANLAMAIGGVFSGTVITEQVFNYPGLGSLLIDAVNYGDYSLVLAVSTVSIAAVAGAIFVVDLLHPLLDPRVRAE